MSEEDDDGTLLFMIPMYNIGNAVPETSCESYSIYGETNQDTL